jgi:hypothetical protein
MSDILGSHHHWSITKLIQMVLLIQTQELRDGALLYETQMVKCCWLVLGIFVMQHSRVCSKHQD